MVQRRLQLNSRWLRYSLAPILFFCEFSYYDVRPIRASRSSRIASSGTLRPLDVAGLIALLTLKPAVFDLAYYYALAGASMSLLTPDMPPSYPALLAVQFFAEHSLLIIAILYLVWSGQARPRPGSVLRAMLAINIYAAFVGTFDTSIRRTICFCAPSRRPSRLSTFSVPGPVHPG